jgi:hypothetical protein
VKLIPPCGGSNPPAPAIHLPDMTVYFPNRPRPGNDSYERAIEGISRVPFEGPAMISRALSESTPEGDINSSVGSTAMRVVSRQPALHPKKPPQRPGPWRYSFRATQGIVGRWQSERGRTSPGRDCWMAGRPREGANRVRDDEHVGVLRHALARLAAMGAHEREGVDPPAGRAKLGQFACVPQSLRAVIAVSESCGIWSCFTAIG